MPHDLQHVHGGIGGKVRLAFSLSGGESNPGDGQFDRGHNGHGVPVRPLGWGVGVNH